jgi:hypothetical protein
MNKPKLLKVLNPVLAVVFVMLAGGGMTRSLAPDVIPYEQFRAIHPVLGWTVATLVALHLWLNWTWIKSNFFKRAAKPK